MTEVAFLGDPRRLSDGLQNATRPSDHAVFPLSLANKFRLQKTMKHIVNSFAKLARFFDELNAKTGKTSVRTSIISFQPSKFDICSNDSSHRLAPSPGTISFENNSSLVQNSIDKVCPSSCSLPIPILLDIADILSMD